MTANGNAQTDDCNAKESEWHTRLPLHVENGNAKDGVIVHHDKELHIAPMLDVSNREFRQFMRILSKRCVLWTEMVVDETINFTRHSLDVYLGHEDDQINTSVSGTNTTSANNTTTTSRDSIHPIICQIGGNNPEYSGKATQVVEDEFGYDEINFNIDCPSDRVSGKREFGAVLMKKIDTAVAVMKAIQNSARNIPVSVKCRVGIDEHDGLEYVVDFIRQLEPYCKRFYLHARKCILGGLSPAQNRIVPPLNYPRVYLLCTMFPNCEFWINGGIPGLKIAKELCYGTALCANTSDPTMTNMHQNKNGETDEELLMTSTKDMTGHFVPCKQCGARNGSCTVAPPLAPPNLRGCMLGRAARDIPCMFWDVDRYFYGEPANPCNTRREVLDKYCAYLDRVYPRRCCDSNDEVTKRIPSPEIELLFDGCIICQPRNTDAGIGDDDHNGANGTTNSSYSIAPNDGKQQPKFTVHVMGRVLQPILGLFHGLAHSRKFRRTCDEYRMDQSVRNCGPAFIIREIMKTVPDNLLDRQFVRTEDLSKEDVPVHVAPAVDCCQQRELALARRRKHLEARQRKKLGNAKS